MSEAWRELLRYPNPEGLHPVEAAWRDHARQLLEELAAANERAEKLKTEGSALHFVLEGFFQRGEMHRIQWKALDTRWREALRSYLQAKLPEPLKALTREALRPAASCRVCATKAAGLPTPGYTHDPGCPAAPELPACGGCGSETCSCVHYREELAAASECHCTGDGHKADCALWVSLAAPQESVCPVCRLTDNQVGSIRQPSGKHRSCEAHEAHGGKIAPQESAPCHMVSSSNKSGFACSTHMENWPCPRLPQESAPTPSEERERRIDAREKGRERLVAEILSEQPDLPLGHEFVAGHPHPAYQSYCALRGIFGLCGQPESVHRRKP